MNYFSDSFERLSAALEHGTPRTWKSLGAQTEGDPNAVAATQLERKELTHAWVNGTPIVGRLSVRACMAVPGAEVFGDDFGQVGKWLISEQLAFKAPQSLDIAAGEYDTETHLIVTQNTPANMDAVFAREQRAQSEKARKDLGADELKEIMMLEAMFNDGVDLSAEVSVEESDVPIARTTRNTLPGPVETTDGFKPSEIHAGVIEAFRSLPNLREPTAMLHTVTGESIYPSAEWQHVTMAIDWLLAGQR